MLLNKTPIDRNRLVAVKNELKNVLSLYKYPPQEEITIDEFELVALDRLQLLRGIDNLRTRAFEGDAFKNHLTKLERKYMPMTGKSEERRKDLMSHFILRLAYCRSEDLRRWFITQECHLLKFRLESLTDIERKDFMENNDMLLESVPTQLKLAKQDKLIGLSGVDDRNIGSAIFYKVPFTQALQLVSSRQVYLEGGYAYVPLTKLNSIIVHEFKQRLSEGMEEAARAFDFIALDTRIGPLLKNMSKQYVGADFVSNRAGDQNKLLPEQVDAAAENHMPLCMRHLHGNLKREGKLKHWGRLQYGLFLKGAGMDMEGAMVFWQSFFAKIMSTEAFTKQYAYSFRHMYGKEGARKNYTPYSCAKIIMGTPPEIGAYHGCPYKHLPDKQLAALISGLRIGVNNEEVEQMVRTAKSGNPQIACQRHFDLAHPGHTLMDLGKGSDAAANHPNMWYQASVQYHRVKSGGVLPLSSSSAGAKAGKRPSHGDTEDSQKKGVIGESVPSSMSPSSVAGGSLMRLEAVLEGSHVEPMEMDDEGL